MKKIKGIRRGSIWVNIFEGDYGEIAITINKSYPGKNGEWKSTNFLRPDQNDLQNLVEAIDEFNESQNGTLSCGKQNLGRWSE